MSHYAGGPVLPRKTGEQYERDRERKSADHRESSQSVRDIAPLPPIADPERRAACERNFRLFCETYLPETFPVAWSPDHLRVIDRIETAVLEGGLFGMAMPRGSGKTSLIEAAAVWAEVYGHRQFVCIVGADEPSAQQMLESVKSELENNEMLLADFPEVCYPIARLEGIAQRAHGQLLNGVSTGIVWSAKEMIFPTVPGSKSSGSVVRVAGITGRIRGMKHKRMDGSSIRPDLVLIDDPQTDESARSPSQCASRSSVLSGAILGLSGPKKKIAGLMTVTVIRPGDMADEILDRQLHPSWQGERTKMVYRFPENIELWDQYAEVRADALRAGLGSAPANEFYSANRAAMDAGSEVAWPERYNPDELSAIQHAMNIRYERGDHAFFAEYQNEPIADISPDTEAVSAAEIMAKLNGIDRGVVPHTCTRLSAFVDVQQRLLFWSVVAWEDEFTGYVVDYGVFPEQREAHFTNLNAKATLQVAYPAAGLEGAIYGGLSDLFDTVIGKEWPVDDGSSMRVGRALIDANWGQSTAVVYQFCRQSRHASILTPSHGKYIGASSIPMGEYRRKRGDRVGVNWRIPGEVGGRGIRHVVYDTNFWKSFVHTRLGVSMGDPGCLSLFGRSQQAHRMFAEHLTSETCIRTEGRGRQVDEWKPPPDGHDNHWLDCIVGCAVAGSILGASTVGHTASQGPPPAKRLKLSDLQRQKGR